MRRSTRAALLSLAALGAAGLCAPPATAAELLLTYTGAIDPSNSQDQLNIFTGSLSGGTLVVSMLVDTDPLPGATASSFVGPAPGWQLTGNGAASPILSYTASVNGVAFDLCAVVADCGDPATNGLLQREDEYAPDIPSFPEYWTSQVAGEGFGADIFIDDDSDRLPHGSDLSLPPGTYSSADGYGFVVVAGAFEQTGDYPQSSVTSNTGVLTVQAVPEPAAWALMIAGFGLTGAALRRRKVCGSVGVH